MRPRDTGPADAGVSLVELLITIVILGVVVLAVVTGILTSIRASTANRAHADLEVAARDYAEVLKLTVSKRTGTGWCSGSSYAVSFAVSGVATSNSPGACPGPWTSGSTVAQVQNVTVTVSKGGRSETVTVVVAPICPLVTCA